MAISAVTSPKEIGKHGHSSRISFHSRLPAVFVFERVISKAISQNASCFLLATSNG
jgi:hypothetical protein